MVLQFLSFMKLLSVFFLLENKSVIIKIRECKKSLFLFYLLYQKSHTSSKGGFSKSAKSAKKFKSATGKSLIVFQTSSLFWEMNRYREKAAYFGKRFSFFNGWLFFRNFGKLRLIYRRNFSRDQVIYIELYIKTKWFTGETLAGAR